MERSEEMDVVRGETHLRETDEGAKTFKNRELELSTTNILAASQLPLYKISINSLQSLAHLTFF